MSNLQHAETGLLCKMLCKRAGGELIVGSGVKEAYETGNGSVLLRAKITIEGDTPTSGKSKGATSKGRRGRAGSAAEDGGDGAAGNGVAAGGGRQLIVVTEMPYQVNKVGY